MDIGARVGVTAWLWSQGCTIVGGHQASGGLGRPRCSSQGWEVPAFRVSRLPHYPRLSERILAGPAPKGRQERQPQ